MPVFINELMSNVIEAVNHGHPTALISLFLISALTEVGIPFPFILDCVLLYTGYRIGLISTQAGSIMLSLFIGRVAGASIIYWLTRLIGKVFVNWISRRFPSVQKRMDWLTAKLNRKAPLAVAVARLTPGLLTPSTVAAGIIRLHYPDFILGIAISSIIADVVLLVLGFATGQGLESLGINPSWWFMIIGLLMVIGAGWTIRRRLSRRNEVKKDSFT